MNKPANRPLDHGARPHVPRPDASAMPHDDTSLASRIDAIEENLQKLRRDTNRISAMTTRNREDLGHALADLDELLYGALATGRELVPGDAPRHTPGGAAGIGADPPRCTHPAHDADPPETRPAATHLITLRSLHSGHRDPHPPLPRCTNCAGLLLTSPSAPRIIVRNIAGDHQPANTPRCQSPVHLAGDLPPATTVIVTAGVRPGIRYCDACAETTRATLERHRIACESAPIVARKRVRPKPSAGRR